MKRILAALADGKSPNAEELLWLKVERGTFKKLRNAFAAFDHEHDFPPVLDELTTRIGHVQDGLNVADTEYLQKAARRLNGYFTVRTERKLNAEIDAFHAEKRKGFSNWVRGQRKELIQILDQDSVRPMSFTPVAKSSVAYRRPSM